MEGSEKLSLDEMVTSYNNSFRVGDISLQNIISPVQDSINASISLMNAYRASVTAAVAQIKALEERDRQLAEAQAAMEKSKI